MASQMSNTGGCDVLDLLSLPYQLVRAFTVLECVGLSFRLAKRRAVVGR